MWSIKPLILLTTFVFIANAGLLPTMTLPDLTVSSVIKQTINIGTSAMANSLDYVPSANEILRLPVHILSGLPSKLVFSVISELCSLTSQSTSTQPKQVPLPEKMNLILYTRTANISFPLKDPTAILEHPAFDRNRSLCIFVTGWLTDINETNSAIESMYGPYMTRDDINFIILDSGKYIDSLYTWSSVNTQPIGEQLGIVIAKIAETYPVGKIHVIGHSLGSHISGAAGKSYKKVTGKLLPHITGLDPAKPCFREGEVLAGLERGDAEFIDIIHTNPGVLGKEEAFGDVDFYPNGEKPIQPGCLTAMCAHTRAVELYAHTVRKIWELSYLSIKCNSLSAVRNQRCTSDPIPMGLAVPHTAKGIYFLETTGTAPFF